jgi:hypothetical protein
VPLAALESGCPPVVLSGVSYGVAGLVRVHEKSEVSETSLVCQTSLVSGDPARGSLASPGGWERSSVPQTFTIRVVGSRSTLSRRPGCRRSGSSPTTRGSTRLPDCQHPLMRWATGLSGDGVIPSNHPRTVSEFRPLGTVPKERSVTKSIYRVPFSSKTAVCHGRSKHVVCCLQPS